MVQKSLTILFCCALFLEAVSSFPSRKQLREEKIEQDCTSSLVYYPIKDFLPCEAEPTRDIQPLNCKTYLEFNEQIGTHESPSSQQQEVLLFSKSKNGEYFTIEHSQKAEYEFLQISIEIWIKAERINLFEKQDDQSFSHPKTIDKSKVWLVVAQKELNEKQGKESKQKYLFERVKNKESNWKWKVFRLQASFDVRQKIGRQPIKLMVHNESPLFLKVFKIEQTHTLDNLIENCEEPNRMMCIAPQFKFEPSIRRCLFNLINRCPLGFFENVQNHTCVSQCSDKEFLHELEDGYLICFEGFQTCDQNSNKSLIGCHTCDKSSSICFLCYDGYILNSSEQTCIQIQQTEELHAIIPYALRLLYTANCVSSVCIECQGGNICLKCRSPFVNVHGACVLCGRGTILDTSTDDHYCRKTTNKFGCSNYDSASSTCLGCFKGITNASCDFSTQCPTPSQFEFTPSNCQNCSTYIPNCTSCASAYQCHTCSSGFKLAISDYSIMNPNVVCVASCAAGFFEDQYGFCAPCGSNCDSCTYGSKICSACKTGFEVDTKYSKWYPTRKQRCIPVARCPVNCDSCSDKNTCTSCSFGYGKVNGQCEKCASGCKICSSSTICIECVNGSFQSVCPMSNCSSGSYLNGSLTCVACMANCIACWNPDSCDICNQGYVLEKNSCVQCPTSCEICRDMNTCVMCATGYNLQSGICVTDPSPCPLQYYDLGFSTCKSCDSNCAQCSLSTGCTACSFGTPKNGKCLNCFQIQYIDSSLNCIALPTHCTLAYPLIGCVDCAHGYFWDKNLLACSPVSTCGDGDMVTQFIYLDNYSIKQCDDNNKLDDDGCDSTCQIEDGYSCTYSSVDHKSTCKKTPKNRFWLEQKINYDNLHPIIVVKFKDKMLFRNLRFLQSQQDLLNKKVFNSMVIDIEDISSDSYTYSVNVNLDDSSKSFDIEFNVTKNIIQKHVTVTLISSFVLENDLMNSSEKTLLPDTRPIDEGDKKIADAIATAGSVTGKTFLITVIPVILFSKFSFLFNALDLFQMIYYLQFVNIRFPYNVSEFLRIMSSFKVPFSLNFFKWFLEADPVESPVVPAKFTEKQIDGVFLKNTGDHYSQVTIIIVVHLILVGIAKVTVNSSTSFVAKAGGFLDEKLTSSWQWGWYLDKFWEMFLSIVVGSMLQFYGLNAKNFSSIINLIFFLLSVAVIVLSPVLFWKKISKERKTLNSKGIKQKWGMLYEGLNIKNRSSQIVPIGSGGSELKGSNSELRIEEEGNQNDDGKEQLANNPSQINNHSQAELDISLNQSVLVQKNSEDHDINEMGKNEGICSTKLFSFGKYFYVGLYLRKIFFGAFIGGLYNFTLTQLMLIDSLNVFIVIFLTAVKPYEKCMYGLKGIICELLMITAQFSLKFLIDDPVDGDESDRMKIGWVFVGACVMILFLQMIFVLVSLCMDLYKQIQDWLKKRKQEIGEQNGNDSESQQAQNEGELNVIDLDDTQDVMGHYVESSNQNKHRNFSSSNYQKVSRLKKIQIAQAYQEEIELEEKQKSVNSSKANFYIKKKNHFSG